MSPLRSVRSSDVSRLVERPVLGVGEDLSGKVNILLIDSQ